MQAYQKQLLIHCLRFQLSQRGSELARLRTDAWTQDYTAVLVDWRRGGQLLSDQQLAGVADSRWVGWQGPGGLVRP